MASGTWPALLSLDRKAYRPKDDAVVPSKDDRPTPEQRRRVLRVLQFVGVTDILLGAALAFLGPGLIGGEPAVDVLLRGGGAILAVSGVAVIGYGRYRLARDRNDENSRQVSRMRD